MNKILNWIEHKFIALAIPLALYLLLVIFAPSARGGTLLTLLYQAIPAAILAFGQIYAVKIGIWNFSIGATVLVAGIIGGNIGMMMGGSTLVLMICMIVCGGLAGLLTGTLFIVLKIPSILVSIGMLFIYESLCMVTFGGGGIQVGPGFQILGAGVYPIMIGAVAFGISYIIYNELKFGIHLRAVGNDMAIAKQQGIDINRLRIAAFTLNGLFAGVFAITQVAASGIMMPMTNMGSMSMVFNAFMCSFMALSIEKHINLIVGVFIGSITMQLIKFGVVALGASGDFQQAIIAIVLIIFAASSAKNRSLENLKHKIKEIFRKKASQEQS